jgi:hypothetical protein
MTLLHKQGAGWCIHVGAMSPHVFLQVMTPEANMVPQGLWGCYLAAPLGCSTGMPVAEWLLVLC